MFDATAVALACLAGFIYTITPGPGFLYLTKIVAEKNAKEGFKFIFGSYAGDLFWICVAVFSLIYSARIDPNVFHVIGILCGVYLSYLGLKALRSQPVAETDNSSVAAGTMRHGFILSFLNPKSYPVLLATIAGFLSGHITDNHPAMIIAAMMLGAICGDLLLIYICSHAAIKKLYLCYSGVIVKAIGALFCFFGISLLWESVEKILAG